MHTYMLRDLGICTRKMTEWRDRSRDIYKEDDRDGETDLGIRTRKMTEMERQI